MNRWGWASARVLLALIITAVVLIPGPWGTSTGRMRPGPPVPGIPGDQHRGERLFSKLDCIRCHSEPRTTGGINVPPPLSTAGSRANAAWMVEYLLDPHPIRYQAEGILPDLRMPRANVSRGEVIDLVAFLAGQIDTSRVSFGISQAVGANADSLIEKGKVLFEQYQCLGCHELGREGRRIGPALDEVGARRRRDYVLALLLDPQRVIPGTAMKDFDLWDDEAEALATFLGTLKQGDVVWGSGAGIP